jgi:hypothetical protein
MSQPALPTFEELLDVLERRKQEIRGAIIPAGPKQILTDQERPVPVTLDTGMVIDLPEGRLVVPVPMAEALLNDGFLYRNSIQIRLFES